MQLWQYRMFRASVKFHSDTVLGDAVYFTTSRLPSFLPHTLRGMKSSLVSCSKYGDQYNVQQSKEKG